MRSAITQLSYFFFLSVAISFGISLSVCGLCVFFFFFDMFMFVCTIPFNSSSPPLSFYQSVYSIYSIYCRLKKKKNLSDYFLFSILVCYLSLHIYIQHPTYRDHQKFKAIVLLACLVCLLTRSVADSISFRFFFPPPVTFVVEKSRYVQIGICLSSIYLSIRPTLFRGGGVNSKKRKIKNEK